MAGGPAPGLDQLFEAGAVDVAELLLLVAALGIGPGGQAGAGAADGRESGRAVGSHELVPLPSAQLFGVGGHSLLELLCPGPGQRIEPRSVQDHGLESLAAHDRAQSTPGRVPGGMPLPVGDRHRGPGKAHLPGRSAGDDAGLGPETAQQLLRQGVVAQAPQPGGRFQLGPVPAQNQDQPLLFGKASLNGHRLEPHPGQILGRVAPGVGFLDPAGEGTLAAHGEASGGGGRGSGKKPRGQDQNIGYAQGMTFRVYLLFSQGRDLGPAAQKSQVRRGRRPL